MLVAIAAAVLKQERKAENPDSVQLELGSWRWPCRGGGNSHIKYYTMVRRVLALSAFNIAVLHSRHPFDNIQGA